MKKIFALLLALAMIMAMCACGKTEEQTVTAEVANPMVEYDSLEALNDAYGIKLTHPGVMGVTDESFNAITGSEYDVAQYKFTVAGTEYCFRCAPTDNDISGIYVGDSTLFANFTGDANAATEDYFGARWFTLDGQYCLTASAENLTAESFAACAEELEAMTETANSTHAAYEDLVGSYQDSWSGRASADVTLAEDGNSAIVYISWANSASEAVQWTLNCTFGEDGLLYYVNGNEMLVNYDEDTSETISEELEGWFEVDDNLTLYWTGASEENCKECVFEKMPQ